MAIDFINNVDEFMTECIGDRCHRFRSYDIVHNEFLTAFKNSEATVDVDNLALKLYAFLASWGMAARGLLTMQKNYRFFEQAVQIVCEDKYRFLADIDVFNHFFDRQKYIDAVLELKSRLNFVLHGAPNPLSDTLVTKIMLGTLGCIPAYDTHIVSSLRRNGYCAVVSERGLSSLLGLADTYKNEIKELLSKYNDKTETPYSVMKFIDMALWK